MQVAIETTEGLGRRLALVVKADEINAKKQKELIDLAKKAKIDGFRKGKVPLDMIEKRYGASVMQDVLSSLMQKAFIDAIVEAKINPAGAPTYTAEEYKNGEDFTFTVEFDVYPTIQVKGLENIEIEKVISDVKESDVDTMIETLRKQQGTWVAKADAAQNEDKVTLDFVGKVDGVEFEGGKGNDFVLILGQSRMIPGFEEAIVGHKAGDKFEISVTFPENYHSEALKGKPAVFDVTLKAVDAISLPELTTDHIKMLGIPDGSMDLLRLEIRKNMERELKGTIANRIKQQVIEGLIQQNDILIPKALIEKEIDVLKEQAVARMGNKNKANELPNEIFEAEAVKRVKTGLIFSQIIEDQKIEANEDKINEIIDEIASAYEDPTEVKTYYQKDKKALGNIRAVAIEEQVVEFVKSKAKISEKEILFSDVMGSKAGM